MKVLLRKRYVTQTYYYTRFAFVDARYKHIYNTLASRINAMPPNEKRTWLMINVPF